MPESLGDGVFVVRFGGGVRLRGDTPTSIPGRGLGDEELLLGPLIHISRDVRNCLSTLG